MSIECKISREKAYNDYNFSNNEATFLIRKFPMMLCDRGVKVTLVRIVR